MTFEYKATRDTSELIEATGYWSGNTVYFNSDPKKIVVIDQGLKVGDLPRILREYLKAHIKDELLRILQERLARSNKPLIEFIASGSLRPIVYFTGKITAFDHPEFKKGRRSIWPRIAAELAKTHDTEEAQRDTLAGKLALALLSDSAVIRTDKRIRSMLMLIHPWLGITLDVWQTMGKPLEDTLIVLAELAFQDQLDIVRGNRGGRHPVAAFHAKSRNVLSGLRARGVTIPDLKIQSDLERLGNLSVAAALLLGILQVRKMILLPAAAEPRKTMSLQPAMKAWTDRLPESSKSLTAIITFLHRLLACSTIDTPADIPGDITKFIHFIPDPRILNRTLTPLLKSYSEENGLTAFPLHTLNRLKARRNAAAGHYTVEWLKEQGVPDAWVTFAVRLRSASDVGDQAQRAKIRTIINWAWFERNFECPADILPTDLRDPHHPEREDTLYRFIENRNVVDKWAFWNHAGAAFRLVHNQSKIVQEDAPLLTENPFEHLENPFRSRTANTTYRHRIPTNQHEAMLHVLLSPDENGNPTWSFVRETLKWDWFDYKNHSTGKFERTWCPSRTRCLALLLMLPARGKQARWLDQGLMDQKVWDVETKRYIENNHPLRDWRHPISGQMHIQLYGRPSGVLQPIRDAWSDEEQLCVFVNTNKTQLWDPQQVTGYEIWWPRGNQLRDWDIANLAHQGDYLDRPYRTLEEQLTWMQRYDPDPTPVTFLDSSIDAASVNKDLADRYPYFVPIFRDLTSPYHRKDGTEYFLPASKDKLDRLFDALAVYTEKRLRKQSLNVVLTEPVTGNRGYKHRRCRYDLHSLRVYGVSYLMEIGVPWPIVQMIVGHRTPTLTLHYNKPTPEFIHQVLAEKITGKDILIDWCAIEADLIREGSRFIGTNPAFTHANTRYGLTDGVYTGFVQVAGGMCPLGGNACDKGQVIETEATANGKPRIDYGPVVGGCGNCRFFCMTPAHLLQQQMVTNDLFIQIRGVGKQISSIAEKLSELQWMVRDDPRNAQEAANLKSQLENMENKVEPMVREWLNRSQMHMQMVERLDDFIAFLKERNQKDGALILLSASTADDLAPEVEIRMEKTGEFELVRQTLLAAHLQGGIEHCSSLSRAQVREFVDRIMIHDDPNHLVLRIRDENTRDKVAFLMAEAMAAVAGSTNVQKALDGNKGLKESGLVNNKYRDLRAWISGIFKSAERDGAKATMASLLPASLHVIDGDKEVGA